MSSEQLSIRLAPDLMARVRDQAETSQANLTMTASRLLAAGLTAEATSAMLNSRLEAANAEIARLKTMASSTFSTAPIQSGRDATFMAGAGDGIGSTLAPSLSAIALSAPVPRQYAVTAAREDDARYAANREAARFKEFRAKIAERQSFLLRGMAVGAGLFMIALVSMPYDWWFPQLMAQASMGGRGIDPGARLVGYDNGVQMLDRVCPMFEKKVADYKARLAKANATASSKGEKLRGNGPKPQVDPSKRHAGRHTAKGQQ
jgi:hypothetical protein